MTNMWHTKSNAILYHRVSLTAMKFYPYHRKHRCTIRRENYCI